MRYLTISIVMGWVRVNDSELSDSSLFRILRDSSYIFIEKYTSLSVVIIFIVRG